VLTKGKAPRPVAKRLRSEVFLKLAKTKRAGGENGEASTKFGFENEELGAKVFQIASSKGTHSRNRGLIYHMAGLLGYGKTNKGETKGDKEEEHKTESDDEEMEGKNDESDEDESEEEEVVPPATPTKVLKGVLKSPERGPKVPANVKFSPEVLKKDTKKKPDPVGLSSLSSLTKRSTKSK
jgi:hypothetical protein